MNIKCKVCGHRFEPKKDRTYLVHHELTPFQALSATAMVQDAIDCPKCGCQHLLAVRLPKWNDLVEEGVEKENETESET